MKLRYFEFKNHSDDRGSLVAVESNKDIPFNIKRVYYLFDTDASCSRGFHAHKTLQQVLICVSGECDICLDDGHERETVRLSNPSCGLYVGNNIWREMSNFSKDAVLLVLASELYDESDYIRNYDEFLRYVGVDK